MIFGGDQIEKNEMGGACSAYEVEQRCLHDCVVRKHEGKGKRQLGRSKFRWKNDIKMNLKQVGWAGWTGLLWLRIGGRWRAVLNAVMNLRVP